MLSFARLRSWLIRAGAGAVAACACLWAAACGGIPGGAVATVDGTAITRATFEHWLSAAAASSAPAPTTTATGKLAEPVVPDPHAYTACIAHLEITTPKPKGKAAPPSRQALKRECEQQYQALKSTVLGYLIDASWIIKESAKQGVSVSDAAVYKRFDEAKKAQFPDVASFKVFLARTGFTVSDVLLRLKVEMLARKLERKVTKTAARPVGEQEAAKYYAQHRSDYRTPQKANASVILTKTAAAARRARQQISSGKSFASVAKAVSIDPLSKSKGGRLVGISREEEEPALGRAIFSARRGVLSGPVRTPFGYYVFELEKLTPATKEPFASVKASIEQSVTASREQRALHTFVASFQKRWTAQTECLPAYMVMGCKGYRPRAG